jgi:homocysteine S-methyltransferase
VDINDKLWSGRALVAAPEKVREAHELFVAAGCDVISTASYQVPGDRPDLLRMSVQLARRGGARFVAASLGPYGAHLADGSEYHGAYRTLPDAETVLKEYHFPRLPVLLSEKPDVLLFETIPCVVEARAIVALLREVHAEAIISFQCRDDSHLASGEPLEEALAVLLDCPLVIGAGVNCVPPRRAVQLMRIAKRVCEERVSLVAYPNKGCSYDAESKAWRDDSVSAEEWLECAKELLEVGCRMVGGCCQVGPEDIAALRKLI